MTNPSFQSFKDFWPFYLSQHITPVCRGFHYVGTFFGIVLFFYFLSSGLYLMLPLSFVPGYAFAWTGHFGFEKNKPATFKYLRWSFIADFVMLYCFFTGKIRAEVQKQEVRAFLK